MRKPNFSLSALKSQSKLAKKAMRDTAGWFPHLVTDAQGKVSITVDMPANITEWLVTAVANDKQGRLGEATGQFRTTTDVALEMLGPPFMYIGDTADFIVRVNNQLSKPVALSAEITLPERLSNVSGEVTPKAVVPANKEQRWPLRLAASGADGLAALQIGLTAPNGVRVGGAESFDIPIKKPFLTQSYRYQLKDGSLFAGYPASASPERLTVRVESGLLGAALNAATMLVQYPYGCTEQLAHSIAPNLVLMDLLARADIKPEQLGPLAEVLTKAKQNAALGLQKLRANQKADGGFSLWPSDSEASVPVTLIAMQALHYANELNVEGAAKLYNKGIEWLSNQAQSVTASDEFSLARYSLFSTWSPPWQQQADFVNKVVADQAANTTQLIAALNIVLSYKSMSYHSFNKQFC
ncbi:alpha-2-macroglobulin family protein [Methylocucumis oryzae]|uniref:alpha-2-macroglobulin family protein n=1 Tax=Methylocucumis oryzae TaxID=1632867 RepID=UPI0006967E51|nr:alpha-2-macroglobulin family protein [Methylocucumis oryzae]